MNVTQVLELFSNFLDGFSLSAGIDRQEAEEQWAWFSRQLSDRERVKIELGGTESGKSMGAEYVKLYPAQGAED